MKIKKRTLNSLLAITAIILFSITTFNIVRNARIASIINQKNQVCANMSVLLSQEEGIDECFCYYEGFKTDNPEMDSKTAPVCACECVVNGTTISVGVLEPTV